MHTQRDSPVISTYENWVLVCRDDPVVKSTHCCCRGLSPVPNTQTQQLTPACSSSPRGPEALFVFCSHFTHRLTGALTRTRTRTYIYTFFLKKKDRSNKMDTSGERGTPSLTEAACVASYSYRTVKALPAFPAATRGLASSTVTLYQATS